MQDLAEWIIRVLDKQLAELPEVIFESATSDDLDDATGLAAIGIPLRCSEPDYLALLYLLIASSSRCSAAP